MARNGRLLPYEWLPDLADAIDSYVYAWEAGMARWPYRSSWLAEVEDLLGAYFPDASRADLNLTARHLAPFPLRAGHDVP